jgi:predicted unusual protein kinase regulating ubiquinone biosynthesis (AarF/ABC1/UbiB family)
MITEIKELYSLYCIYRKLNAIKSIQGSVDERYCTEIKQMILAGGCIYIKFAQWVISRLRSERGPNIEFVVNFFDDIFDQCPTHSLEHCKQVFRENMDQELEEVVDMSTFQSIASGSVGQVYKARLLKPTLICGACDAMVSETHTGQCPSCFGDITIIEEVAIKIKHPDIDKQIQDKVRLFSFLTMLQRIKWIKDYLHLHMDFGEFIANLTEQANFNNEFDNNRKFRTNFKGNPLVYFPFIITGTADLLITEYVTGTTFDTITEYNQLKCCYSYACMVSQMLVIDNFCHGDLHHGNWKIRPIQLGPSLDYQIIVYDYGICFSASDVRINHVIMESFENNDPKKVLEVITELIDGNFDDAVIQAVEQAVYHYREDSLDLVHLFNTINNLLVRYNCKLTANGMNTVLLLSLIDTTLRKHNLVGGNVSSSTLPRTTPSSIIRSKNLDLIAYAKSRGAYPAYVQYMNEKHERSKDSGSIGLFAACLNNQLELDPPE